MRCTEFKGKTSSLGAGSFPILNNRGEDGQSPSFIHNVIQTHELLDTIESQSDVHLPEQMT